MDLVDRPEIEHRAEEASAPFDQNVRHAALPELGEEALQAIGVGLALQPQHFHAAILERL